MQSNLALFQNLLEAGQRVYVMNNTEPKGLYVITVNNPLSGKSKTLSFPRTWIPTCLTDKLPKDILEKSLEIRDAIEMETLKIIPEQDAVAILNTERGKKEYKRLNESKFAGGVNSKAKTDMLAAAEITNQVKASMDGVLSESEESKFKLHPKMKGWEQRILVGEFDGSTLVNDLEIHKAELTEDDFQFLLTAQFPQEVKAFASDMLNAGKFREAPIVTPTKVVEKYEADWDIVV